MTHVGDCPECKRDLYGHDHDPSCSLRDDRYDSHPSRPLADKPFPLDSTPEMIRQFGDLTVEQQHVAFNIHDLAVLDPYFAERICNQLGNVVYSSDDAAYRAAETIRAAMRQGATARKSFTYGFLWVDLQWPTGRKLSLMIPREVVCFPSAEIVDPFLASLPGGE